LYERWNEAEFAWPEMLLGGATDLLDALDLPGAAARGIPASTDEVVNAAFAFGGLGTGRSIGAASDPTTLGMFGSRGARNAPERLLDEVEGRVNPGPLTTEAMDDLVLSARTHGEPRPLAVPHILERDPAPSGIVNVPLFEIPRTGSGPVPFAPHAAARILFSPDGASPRDLINWPELFRAYPELADIRVFASEPGWAFYGGFLPDQGRMIVNSDRLLDIFRGLGSLDPNLERQLRMTLLHELQHGIAMLDRLVPQGTSWMSVGRAADVAADALGERSAQMARQAMLLRRQADDLAASLGPDNPLTRAVGNLAEDLLVGSNATRLGLGPLSVAGAPPAHRALYEANSGEALARLASVLGERSPDAGRALAPHEWLDTVMRSPARFAAMAGIREPVDGDVLGAIQRLSPVEMARDIAVFPDPGLVLLRIAGIPDDVVTAGLPNVSTGMLPDLSLVVPQVGRQVMDELGSLAASRPELVGSLLRERLGTVLENLARTRAARGGGGSPPGGGGGSPPGGRGGGGGGPPLALSAGPFEPGARPEWLESLTSRFAMTTEQLLPKVRHFRPRERDRIFYEQAQTFRQALYDEIASGRLPLQQLADLPDAALAGLPDQVANVLVRAREWAWAQPGVTRPLYEPGRSARARPGPEAAQPVLPETRAARRQTDAQRALDELRASETPVRGPRKPTDPTVPENFRVDPGAVKYSPSDTEIVRDRIAERRAFIERMTRGTPDGPPPMTRLEAVQAWNRRERAMNREPSVSDAANRAPDLNPVNRPGRKGPAAPPPAPPSTAERFWGQRRAAEMQGPRESLRRVDLETEARLTPRDATRAPRARDKGVTSTGKGRKAAPAEGSDALRTRTSLDERLRAEGPVLKRVIAASPRPTHDRRGVDPVTRPGRAANTGRRMDPAALQDPRNQFFEIPRDLYDEVFRGELPGAGSRTVIDDTSAFVPREEMARFRDAYNAMARERGWQKAMVEPEEAIRPMPDSIRARLSAIMKRNLGGKE
jgi:hypothetical protein